MKEFKTIKQFCAGKVWPKENSVRRIFRLHAKDGGIFAPAFRRIGKRGKILIDEETFFKIIQKEGML